MCHPGALDARTHDSHAFRALLGDDKWATGGNGSTRPPRNVSTADNVSTVDIVHAMDAAVSELSYADVLVFACLQTMGVCAIVGNVTLIVVLVRYKHLSKASFVLVLNMAMSDVLHGLVTTTFFYPPILLRSNPLPVLAQRVIIAVDWTAWGVTIMCVVHVHVCTIDVFTIGIWLLYLWTG